MWTHDASSPAHLDRLTKALNATVVSSLAQAVAEVRVIDQTAEPVPEDGASRAK
jgi:hypothetical protein